MGVPGFFKWICQRYPLIQRNFNDPSSPIVNNLYIDINGKIHHAAAASNLQGPELTDYFLSELYRLIDKEVQFFKPTDLIFISADGVAPFAKATQQRERRFAAGQEHVPDVIDHCSVSPGTDFMLKVHSKLVEFIQNQKKNDLLWSKPRVIYSGVTVPGEGEHKIINYIRENRSLPDWNPNLVHCLCAGDADLFFLALQSHEGYFMFPRKKDKSYVRKNAQVFDARVNSEAWSSDDYEVIHVSLIREYLSIEFDVKGEELELTIDDFIAFSFLIGNDFIPHFKDIDIFENYDDILNIYKEMRKSSPHLVEKGQFNKQSLKVFLTMIVDLLRNKYKDDMQLNLPIDEVSKLYTKSNREYISEKFSVPEDDDAKINELIKGMSNSILDAFDWVLKYYREGCPSWKWFYPYHYAPPLEFVIPFIDDHKTVFEEDFPHPPLLQLLIILPPQAKDLLPKELASLMDSEELKQFYPETVETDLDGRKIEWMAKVLVPMIDVDLLEKKYNEVELPPEVSERLNRLEFPIEFTKDGEIEEVSISKGEVPFQPVYIATKRPSFIPTFENFEFKSETKVVPVKVFWNFYNKLSIVIIVERAKKRIIDVMNLMNTTVLVNWPYLRPAKVVGMMDEANYFNSSSRSIIPLPDKSTFLSSSKTVHDNLLTTQGIELGSISILLTVSIEPNKTLDVPINLVVPASFRPDAALATKVDLPVRKPEINEKIIFTKTSSSVFIGRIIEKKNGLLTVKIIHRDAFPIKPIMSAEINNWVSMSDLVKQIGNISFRGLRQCLRKVIVDPFQTNIAFQLISFDHTVIFGCCKYIEREKTFVFASFVVPHIIEYFKLVGSLKKLVMSSIQRKEKFLANVTLEMLYGGTVEHQNECYTKLITFLTQNAPSCIFPLVNEENNFLSSQSLALLEREIDAFDFKQAEENESVVVKESEAIWKMKKVPNHLRRFPSVGQRVVSVAASGPALFGEKGTVIETIPSANSVVVLFDNVLLGATRFEGVLKSNRGLRLNIENVIVINE